MSHFENLDFQVNRADWRKTRIQANPLSGELKPGQVVFRIDRFAFTANNITYAAAGDMLGYWRFFPAEEGWGRLPTMGFGDVVASTHADVSLGTRCFGFFPMSNYLCIEPATVSATSITDGVAHREGLAAVYNQYNPVNTDALYSADHEDAMILMRGLYMTSFLSEDFMAENAMFGAESVLISSASSKTSISLAFRLGQTGNARAIGLTSPGHLDFVRSLGCYDTVVAYDAIDSLPADTPSAFVDMAGSDAVVRAVHTHFGDQLRHSQRIGVTHWEAPPADGELPGPEREFFFAPSQVQKRVADWGAGGFQQRLGEGWTAFRDGSRAWLDVQRGYGPAAVEPVYHDTLEGRTRPDTGQVLSLWESAEAAAGR